MTLVSAGTESREAEEIQRSFRDRPPIVCFANDWHGDPTSKHHILRTYSEFTDVVWVESSGMRMPRLTSVLDLRRVASKLRKSATGLEAAEHQLHVLSPLSIPLPGNPVARGVNGLLYRRVVRRTLRKLGLVKDPLLWVYTPTVAPYLDGLERSGLVYHCVDRWWAFSDYDEKIMRARHEELCREANVVFASSEALLEDCRPYTPNAYLLPHGVDWNHFSRAAFSTLPRPADVADITGPIIGFFGLIHDWVDQDLLVALAGAFPEATIVLIGKAQTDIGALARVPNIRLLGQKPYADLPAYCAAFDVGVIPFRINELTVAVNPIKLREYLAAGIPVVASAIPAVEALNGNPALIPAQTPAEFISGVASFLRQERDPDARRLTSSSMLPDSWLGRCAEMARLVARHCHL